MSLLCRFLSLSTLIHVMNTLQGSSMLQYIFIQFLWQNYRCTAFGYLFIHPFRDIWFCFHVLSVVNNAAIQFVNMVLFRYLFFFLIFSWEHTSRIATSYSNSMFNFLSNQ